MHSQISLTFFVFLDMHRNYIHINKNNLQNEIQQRPTRGRRSQASSLPFYGKEALSTHKQYGKYTKDTKQKIIIMFSYIMHNIALCIKKISYSKNSNRKIRIYVHMYWKREVLKNDAHGVMCKVDIEKAYDHVNQGILLSILEKLSFRSNA